VRDERPDKNAALNSPKHAISSEKKLFFSGEGSAAVLQRLQLIISHLHWIMQAIVALCSLTRYYKTKLESVSLSCKSHRSKTANIKILSANSTHRR